MKKMILPLIVGIVIGYFLSGQTNQKPKLSENNADEIALDLQDYVRLQNLEDKYKKADEILGKVMLLYLANIAARLDEPSTAYFSKPHEERTHLPEKVRDDSEEKEIAKVERPEVVAREKVSTTPESISEDLVFGPGDFKKEIKKLEKPNVEQALSNPIKTLKLYRRIKGVFTGQIRYEAGKFKGQTHRIELESDFVEEDDQLKGTYYLGMSQDGDYYSENRGSGGNRGIRLSPKKEYILEASPTSFIQVIPKGRNRLIGFYYENNKFTGTVKLER